ncbi:MAG: hypothetical protein CVU86_02130 [Firmicutes bacterium HGW-Firmicutes-11]|nr:MAG: hypothetical protein CVU86_02130 [Firmicutes bacterium HGW-Firmicutes-11]
MWKHGWDLVFPSDLYCISCGKPVKRGTPYALCNGCVRRLHWVGAEACGRCGKPLRAIGMGQLCNDCIDAVREFQTGTTCTRYGFEERELIHRFKYQNKHYYSEPLASLMYERLLVEALTFDLVVPVPMHKTKERTRGYNQAALLSTALSKRSGHPVKTDLLLKSSNTVPFSQLSAEERRTVSDGAYRVNQKWAHLLPGKAVLLIDDVFTTGSTANACSKALKDGGSDRVFVMTFSAGIDPSVMQL